MAKCNQMNCKGEFVERVSEYGPYWICSVCGHKIDKKCICGGKREMTTYNGSSVAKCSKCKKYRY